MKIIIFSPVFHHFILHKDIGQIGFGLKDLGHEISFLTLTSNAIGNFNEKEDSFKIISCFKKDLENKKFWLDLNPDLIIFISWLSYRFYKALETINKTKIPLIIKADTHGRACYPFKPYFLKLPDYFEDLKDFFSYIKYYSLWIISLFFKKYCFKKLSQIKFSEYTIIETPNALRNIAFLLNYYKLDELIKKLEFIPNPVCDDINTKNFSNLRKENFVISVADFRSRAKNKIILAKVLDKFLSTRNDFKAILIGQDSKSVLRWISKKNIKNLECLDNVSHGELIFYLDKSKIFFLPSIWEGSPLSAAEAVVRGCSIVGTPLEGFEFFSAGGFCGTISLDFRLESIFSTLMLDSVKWDKGYYNPLKIGSFWSDYLDRRKIAKDIINRLKL